MASERVRHLRALAEENNAAVFEVNFSNITVLFSSIDNATRFEAAVLFYDKSVQVDYRGRREGVEHLTLSLG